MGPRKPAASSSSESQAGVGHEGGQAGVGTDVKDNRLRRRGLEHRGYLHYRTSCGKRHLWCTPAEMGRPETKVPGQPWPARAPAVPHCRWIEQTSWERRGGAAGGGGRGGGGGPARAGGGAHSTRV